MLRRSIEGRRLGWFLERDRIRLAKLTAPQFAEMFWDQYEVTPAPGVAWDVLGDRDLWVSSERVQFRNAGTGDIAPFAFQGGPLPTPESPIVVMRALKIECPSLFVRIYEWVDANWPPTPFGLCVFLLALARGLARHGARRARELFRLTIVW